MGGERAVYRRESKAGTSVWVAHATWTEGGRRRQTKRTFRTKKEAQAALVQILSDRGQGTYVEPIRLRLRDYAGSWLDGVANQGRKATTLRGYRRTIELYLLPHLGYVPLQELTVSDFDALYAKLLRSGGRHGTGLSLTSVHHVHAVVNKMLNDAERKGLVVRNVARLADAPTLTAARSPGPEMRVWSPSELATFLRAVEGNPWEAVFRLLAMTGLRRSEAMGLRWADLELGFARLTVRQACDDGLALAKKHLS